MDAAKLGGRLVPLRRGWWPRSFIPSHLLPGTCGILKRGEWGLWCGKEVGDGEGIEEENCLFEVVK